MTKHLTVVGAGFAGVRAALAAADVAARAGGREQIAITVVSPDPVMGIRPRFYEDRLDGVLVPLDRVLAPVGIRFRRAFAEHLDPDARTLALGGAEPGTMSYDQLVLAAGSRLRPPDLDGSVHAVDSFAQARRLQTAIADLAADTDDGLRATVVGAGFTGLETAAELAGRLRRVAQGAGIDPAAVGVALVERSSDVAPEFGPRAREAIAGALEELGVETLTGREVEAVADGGVRLAGGDTIPSLLTVWAGGPTPSAVGGALAGLRDESGRIRVGRDLSTAADGIWAAGDIARVSADGDHDAVMSCQHALPQGSQAGANAARALVGKPSRRYAQHLYLTCLDLGGWGALLTEGWDRDRVLATGDRGKAFKRFINRGLIYPPATGRAKDLIAYGRPENVGPASAWVQRRALGVPLVRRAITGRAPDTAGEFAG